MTDSTRETTTDEDEQMPECPHEDGHAWVGGGAEVVDEETRAIRFTSRQCRRCGYVHEFDDE